MSDSLETLNVSELVRGLNATSVSVIYGDDIDSDQTPKKSQNSSIINIESCGDIDRKYNKFFESPKSLHLLWRKIRDGSVATNISKGIIGYLMNIRSYHDIAFNKIAYKSKIEDAIDSCRIKSQILTMYIQYQMISLLDEYEAIQFSAFTRGDEIEKYVFELKTQVTMVLLTLDKHFYSIEKELKGRCRNLKDIEKAITKCTGLVYLPEDPEDPEDPDSSDLEFLSESEDSDDDIDIDDVDWTPSRTNKYLQGWSLENLKAFRYSVMDAIRVLHCRKYARDYWKNELTMIDNVLMEKFHQTLDYPKRNIKI